MDPELQGDQNAEFKPSYDVQVTRDEAPDLRETNQDFSQLAKEEAQMEQEDMGIEGGTSQEHLTKSGEPDMRFKENQSSQGQNQNQGQTQSQSSNQRGNRNQQQQDNRRNVHQSEHLTQAGEPDMRFKENQESYGQS